MNNEAWKDGWVPRKKPNEYKYCVICRKTYPRRFPNGRYRSDKLWAQKKTCSNKCNTRRMWLLGVYDQRGQQ